MSGYRPSATFHNAAGYLTSAPSLSKLSHKVKLELYGLFKYLTVSPLPDTTRPSIFDITGRAKWDAWKSVSATYEGRYAEPENRYLDIARQLGWTENASLPSKTLSGREQDTEPGVLEQLDDSEDGSGSGGAMWGMGNTVSTFAGPAMEDEPTTIHSLALSNDVDGLISLLRGSPDIDPNERDEFGYTPLHLAADRGNLGVLELLLRQGADPYLKDPDDFTALELAQVAGHEHVRKLLDERVAT